MIERITKVQLKPNIYSSFCFLANVKQNEYVTDVRTAKNYFRQFLDKSDLQEINQNNVKYVMFTKEM